MKTVGLRIYGKRDLRLEAFELPPIGEGELLVKIVSDSLCMSSFKASELGRDHKRVPDNVMDAPTVIGHECCGEIIKAGSRWRRRFSAGDRFALQPAMSETQDAIGYSFRYIGGNMLYGIVPECYVEHDCVLPYSGDGWYGGSLAEPLSCVIGAAHASYHTGRGSYVHRMGVKKDGKTAILAGAGPMGLAMADYLIHSGRKPSMLIVTDIDGDRLNRAQTLLSPGAAKKAGVHLVYLNTGTEADPVGALKALSDGGFDDVFVFAPVTEVIEQADAVLGYDGCLNFFAGPVDTALSARCNFYNVHYNAAHIVGTSGGNSTDMREALDMAARGDINPAILVTHIGGLDAAAEATLKLPEIPGGKKLIYNHISLPLTAISDFGEIGGPLFSGLDRICAANGGLWCAEAESFLLENAKAFTVQDAVERE